MFKKAEELVKGDIVNFEGKTDTVTFVGKLFNPGNRLQLISVHVTLKNQPANANISVFPPGAVLEIVSN